MRGKERKWNKENLLLFFRLAQSEDLSSPGGFHFSVSKMSLPMAIILSSILRTI